MCRMSEAFAHCCELLLYLCSSAVLVILCCVHKSRSSGAWTPGSPEKKIVGTCQGLAFLTPESCYKKSPTRAEGLDFRCHFSDDVGKIWPITAGWKLSGPQTSILEALTALATSHESSGARLEPSFQSFLSEVKDFHFFAISLLS